MPKRVKKERKENKEVRQNELKKKKNEDRQSGTDTRKYSYTRVGIKMKEDE